ncbi:MAG TPA: hypothetical protein VMN39_11140, partial [Longimicrobiaceae bacterium]|nr:hypothetical protein [Longimicrobiaceae bacterium]
VRRREGDGVRIYSYIGTGNLNAATAASYTDLGLLTADPHLGEEIERLFATMAGDEPHDRYERLIVAPFNMRRRFVELIRRETDHAGAGRTGGMTVKLNGVADREIIAALYDASAAGVNVTLVVRGICSLRPGVPGLSENIRVLSAVGRFLEHSRIFRFDNAGDRDYYIGSADWRGRNLTRRVEVVAPVVAPDHRRILDRVLEAELARPDIWELRPDGRYVQVQSGREAHSSALRLDPSAGER